MNTYDEAERIAYETLQAAEIQFDLKNKSQDVEDELFRQTKIKRQVDANSDNKQRNALSAKGQQYKQNMYEYFDNLYTIMDARKWNTIVWAFILNFHSTADQSRVKNRKTVDKRNANLRGQVGSIDQIKDNKAKNFANDLAVAIGQPGVLNQEIVFVGDKIYYPSKKTKKSKLEGQYNLMQKLEYLKNYNMSKKLSKKAYKERINPGRLQKRAYAKSLVKGVSGNGYMKKAIEKMDPQLFNSTPLEQIPAKQSAASQNEMFNAMARGKMKLLQKQFKDMTSGTQEIDGGIQPQIRRQNVQALNRRQNIQPSNIRQNVQPSNRTQIQAQQDQMFEQLNQSFAPQQQLFVPQQQQSVPQQQQFQQFADFFGDQQLPTQQQQIQVRLLPQQPTENVRQITLDLGNAFTQLLQTQSINQMFGTQQTISQEKLKNTTLRQLLKALITNADGIPLTQQIRNKIIQQLRELQFTQLADSLTAYFRRSDMINQVQLAEELDSAGLTVQDLKKTLQQIIQEYNNRQISLVDF